MEKEYEYEDLPFPPEGYVLHDEAYSFTIYRVRFLRNRRFKDQIPKRNLEIRYEVLDIYYMYPPNRACPHSGTNRTLGTSRSKSCFTREELHSSLKNAVERVIITNQNSIENLHLAIERYKKLVKSYESEIDRVTENINLVSNLDLDKIADGQNV
jgi:hypothetical protein